MSSVRWTREQVERHQLVVRVGRGRWAVRSAWWVLWWSPSPRTISCPALAMEMPIYFLYSFFHIADAFEGHLLKPRFDGERSLLPFHLQGAFALKVLLAVTLLAQGLRVRLHVEVQHGFALSLRHLSSCLCSRWQRDGEGIGSVFQLQCMVTIHPSAICALVLFRLLHGGSRQRLFGLSVGDCPLTVPAVAAMTESVRGTK